MSKLTAKQRVLRSVFYEQVMPANVSELNQILGILCVGQTVLPEKATDGPITEYLWSKKDGNVAVKEKGYLNKTFYSLPETTDRIKLRQEMSRALEVLAAKVGSSGFFVRDIFYILQQVAEDNMSKLLKTEDNAESMHVTTPQGGFTLKFFSTGEIDSLRANFHSFLVDHQRGVSYRLVYSLSGLEDTYMKMVISKTPDSVSSE